MSKRHSSRKILKAVGRVLLRIDASIKRQSTQQARAADQLRQIAAAVDNIGFELDNLHSTILASLPGEAPE